MPSAAVSDPAALPRPAERAAIVTLALVFVCGILLGALVMSLVHPYIHTNSTLTDGMSMSTAEWKSQLDLTEDQERQLTSVLADFSRYYGNLLADGNTRILQILNPDQKIKFQRMMAEHKALQKSAR